MSVCVWGGGVGSACQNYNSEALLQVILIHGVLEPAF